MSAITGRHLAELTIGKTVATTAFRWIPFFLPTLALAFSATTTQLTTIIGAGEAAALLTLLVGRRLDAGEEQPLMVIGLGLIAASGLIALFGTLVSFAVSFMAVTVGLSFYTVAGHTYLSARVGFAERGRSIGLFEISWAAALLVGAPVVAASITLFGWRAPFLAVAGGGAIAAVAIARAQPVARPVVTTAIDRSATQPRLTRSAWQVLGASAAIAVAGLATIVVTGTWLTEQLGVSTGGIGLVAMAFGCAELIGSTSSATFSDRLGKARSTTGAMGLVVVGLAIMSAADTSLPIAVVGLVFFFLGFEFGIVTSFSVVSEAMPDARGRVLAMNTAIGTAARGGASIAAGLLYERFGIAGPASLSAIAAATAAILLLTHQNSAAGRTMAAVERR